MSYVIAAPEMMTAAAGDLGNIGSTLTEEHTAAAALTVGLVPAAADEVSAGVAHLFSGYAEDFHGLAGRAAVFQEQFVGHLTAGAHSYASAEAVNISYLLWLAQNVSLYKAGLYLSQTLLGSNNPIFQILGLFVGTIVALPGLPFLLLFLGLLLGAGLLNNFLLKFGI